LGAFKVEAFYRWNATRANPPYILFFLFLLFKIIPRWHFDLKKLGKYTCGLPAPLVKCHLRVDLTKGSLLQMGQNIGGKIFIFLIGGQNRTIVKVRGSNLQFSLLKLIKSLIKKIKEKEHLV